MQTESTVFEIMEVRALLPFPPSKAFFESVRRFEEKFGLRHLPVFDKFSEATEFAPGFFVQDIAFGEEGSEEPKFLATGFHFEVGGKFVSIFVPACVEFRCAPDFQFVPKFSK